MSGAADLLTRGVVLVPADLGWPDWPRLAAAAGLTTIALHATSDESGGPAAVAAFVRSGAGCRFLEECRSLGLEVEYELHALRELLPRSLFERDPTMFRADEQGMRSPDWNLCVHSPSALELAAENAVGLARVLRPTTGRYFLWGDDARPWCRCPKCRGLSDADQALLLERRLLAALRREDPGATIGHLAYGSTLEPPSRVTPEPGVFLEYAPIHRSYDRPYEEQTDPGCRDRLDALDRNLALFGAGSAQVLEYWLDASRFSRWRRPAARIPWRADVLARDAASYRRRGIRHVTSFAAWVDADYVARHGAPPIEEYGALLRTGSVPGGVNGTG